MLVLITGPSTTNKLAHNWYRLSSFLVGNENCGINYQYFSAEMRTANISGCDFLLFCYWRNALHVPRRGPKSARDPENMPTTTLETNISLHTKDANCGCSISTNS